MKRCWLALILLLPLLGQPQFPASKFDVASVKRNSDLDLRFAMRYLRSGELNATGVTLKMLVMQAYDVPGFQVLGGPPWVISSKWDIQAKAEGVTTTTREQRQQMLLTLLRDRFHLKSHREQRKVPVYELTLEKGGSHLKRANPNETPLTRQGTGSLGLTRASMESFTQMLALQLGRPVIDKTGITGEFDFDLQWTPEANEDGGPTAAGFPPGTPTAPITKTTGPTVFTAIREQLGLRFKATKGPSTVIIVDNAEEASGN